MLQAHNNSGRPPRGRRRPDQRVRWDGETNDAITDRLTVEVGTALVTAARRYCFAREPWLLPANFDPSVFHISASSSERESPALDTDALEWVLVRIEGIDVDRLFALGDLQSHLIRVVRDASREHDEFWNTTLHDDSQSELEALCQYIGGLSPDALKEVKPLPYRRPLAESEVWTIWRRIADAWKLPSTPPARVSATAWRRSHSDVLVSDVETFNQAIRPPVLRSILQELGVNRIWKLGLLEESWSFEMDLAFVDTRCDWGECYWVPHHLDWILYVSHEGDLVGAGHALLSRLLSAWEA